MAHQPLRRACLGALLLALAGGALAPAASAQSAFPNKPITLIVPFPAGGSTDRHMRIVAQDASKYLGQPVIVENRPGAGGTLGTATMSRTAKPDGYTVALYTLAMLRMPYMQKTSWDPINDFTFIIGLSGYTFGFTVRADSPYKTFN
ncbi:tripartite tricarboxylate transporter substrate-binding protein, partial [Achromobacter xylosoxidans]